MTAQEYRTKLNELSDTEFGEFTQQLGCGDCPRKERVRLFLCSPKFEELICDLLGLETEHAKLMRLFERAVEAAECLVSSAVTIASLLSSSRG